MPAIARQFSDPDDLEALRMRIDAGFGVPMPLQNPGPTPETESMRTLTDTARIPELTIGVEDGDDLIGGCFGMAMDYTLPGGAMVPIAGLSGVAIDPSLTGRGGFRAMMEAHLVASRGLGLPASLLYASESGLYGRLGYGRASTVCHYEVVSNRAELVNAPSDTGRIRIGFDAAQIKIDVQQAHDAYVDRPGMTSRTEPIWGIYFHKTSGWLGGGNRFFAIHYDEAGTADGYVAYKVKGDQVGHDLTNSRAMVSEYIGATVEAELALWNYLMTIPLVRFIEFEHAPVDMTAIHYMRDPRQLRQKKRIDAGWLRPLDVEQLLTKRRYDCDGRASFDLIDDLFPDESGTYTITANGGQAVVTRGGEPSGVDLTPAQLGTLIAGEDRLASLARAGVIGGPEAAVRAVDRLFVTDQAPFTLTRF